MTDIDNTLAHDGVIPDAHVAALGALLGDGVTVIVATGRRYRSAYALLERHGIRMPVIALNGAVGFDADGTRFHQISLDPAQAREVLETARRFDATPICSTDSSSRDVWAPRPATEWWEWSSHGHHAEVVDVYDHDWAATGSPSLLSVELIAGTRAEAERLAGELAPAGVEIVIGRTDTGASYLHVTAPGVDKAAGADAWIRRRGVSPQTKVAVGDGTNDIGLLRWADVGVAIEGGEINDHHQADHRVPGPRSGGWAHLPHLLGRGR